MSLDFPHPLIKFTERTEQLTKIKRFNRQGLEVMLYRTNLASHSIRVYWLVNDLACVAMKVPEINMDAATAEALVHDDVEILTGDITFDRKEQMRTAEVAELKRRENSAILILEKLWPCNIQDIPYGYLLRRAMLKDTPASQLRSYADRLDAYCEALHEVFAGNSAFCDVARHYTSVSRERNERYPLIKEIFSLEHALLANLPQLNFERIAKQGTLHTKETVREGTGISVYDQWRKITLSQPEGLELLTRVREQYEEKEISKKCE